jgi:hypothetical protein
MGAIFTDFQCKLQFASENSGHRNKHSIANSLSILKLGNCMELLHQSEDIIAQRYRIIEIFGQGGSGTVAV